MLTEKGREAVQVRKRGRDGESNGMGVLFLHVVMEIALISLLPKLFFSHEEALWPSEQCVYSRKGALVLPGKILTVDVGREKRLPISGEAPSIPLLQVCLWNA
jgi:hypothetical protein